MLLQPLHLSRGMHTDDWSEACREKAAYKAHPRIPTLCHNSFPSPSGLPQRQHTLAVLFISVQCFKTWPICSSAPEVSEWGLFVCLSNFYIFSFYKANLSWKPHCCLMGILLFFPCVLHTQLHHPPIETKTSSWSHSGTPVFAVPTPKSQ